MLLRVSLIFLWSFCSLAELQAKSLHVLTGKVVRILDGDTFELLDNQHVIWRIRLLHIDAPEKKQAFGAASKQFLADLIFNCQVRVEYSSHDRNGRILGAVYKESRFVNLVMVEQGYAWHYKRFSSDLRFANAEQKARKMKIGLWKTFLPTAPWVYRSQ
ncbi:MAG TPA: thermonuclease family protein [Chitinophagaceae bacterium]|nr:thermonuclease family protein [Chitinophagaceae bacterium]